MFLVLVVQPSLVFLLIYFLCSRLRSFLHLQLVSDVSPSLRLVQLELTAIHKSYKKQMIL